MKSAELNHRELSDIYSRLALLLHSGVTVSDGFDILASEEPDRDRVCLFETVAEKLNDGEYLADVLRGTNRFSSSDTGMISAGEQSGKLEETLAALGEYHEQRDRMGRTLRRTLTYPAVLLAVMLVVMVILITKVLPIFDDVYQSLGGSLTGAAAVLLSFGQGLNRILPYIEIGLAVLILAAAILCMIPGATKKMRQGIIRRFGDIGVLRKINNARVAQAFSVALSGGLSIEESIGMAADLMTDCPPAMGRCIACQKMIEDGAELLDALQKNKLFSKSACRMIAIGQRTGSMDAVMEKVASRMYEEAEDALETQMMRIEPTMVVITSVLVGVILLTVMFPLVNIMKTIG